MDKRAAGPDLTSGNATSASPGKTWAEVAGGGRLWLLPITLCTTGMVFQRLQDCRKSWTFPTLWAFFSREIKLNSYAASSQGFAVSEVSSYTCTNAPDSLETALIQTLISLWKTLPIAGPSRWPDLKAGGPAMPWCTKCEWQVAIRALWYRTCTGR